MLCDIDCFVGNVLMQSELEGKLDQKYITDLTILAPYKLQIIIQSTCRSHVSYTRGTLPCSCARLHQGSWKLHSYRVNLFAAGTI